MGEARRGEDVVIPVHCHYCGRWVPATSATREWRTVPDLHGDVADEVFYRCTEARDCGDKEDES